MKPNDAHEARVTTENSKVERNGSQHAVLEKEGATLSLDIWFLVFEEVRKRIPATSIVSSNK
jgi:hypothetical protein